MVITIVWRMVILKPSIIQHLKLVKHVHTHSIYSKWYQFWLFSCIIEFAFYCWYSSIIYLGPCGPFRNSPCLNGGICHNENCNGAYCSDYTCTCPLHYYGKHCQHSGNFDVSYDDKTIFIITFNNPISYIISFWNVYVYFMNQNSTLRVEEVCAVRWVKQ